MAEPIENTTPHIDSSEPSEPALCLNCAAPLQGEYCHRCGQRDSPVLRVFPALVAELLNGLFAFDSKTYRTIWYLFSRPAFLTREYLAGRRARYVPPLRLFIVFVLLALFAISLELFLESLGVTTEPLSVIELEPTTDQIEAPQQDAVEGVSQFLLELEFPFLSQQDNERFVNFLQQRAEQNIPAIQDNPAAFAEQLLESVPILMLFLIPMLALLQKLVYIRSGRYYVEHLVLTVHNHSVLFFAYVVLSILDWIELIDLSFVSFMASTLSTLIGLWLFVYLFLSLRVMFGQGYFKTTVKFIFITIVYGVVLMCGILVMLLIGFLTF